MCGEQGISSTVPKLLRNVYLALPKPAINGLHLENQINEILIKKVNFLKICTIFLRELK